MKRWPNWLPVSRSTPARFRLGQGSSRRRLRRLCQRQGKEGQERRRPGHPPLSGDRPSEEWGQSPLSGSRSPATYSSRSTTELRTASYSTPVRSIIGMESTSSMYPGGDSSQRGSRRWRMLSVSSPLPPQAAAWKPNQMGVSRYKDQYLKLTANHIRTPPRRKYLRYPSL